MTECCSGMTYNINRQLIDIYIRGFNKPDYRFSKEVYDNDDEEYDERSTKLVYCPYCGAQL